MTKKYFNKRARKRAKTNLKKKPGKVKGFSKRMGGIDGVSMIVENRNVNARDLSIKKEVLQK